MADIGKAPEGFPRRMQAARALAGLTIDQLAERLKDEPGLSPRSLRDIESGKANVQRSRQWAIIEACDMTPVFATANLWLLETLDNGLSEIPTELRERLGDDGVISRAFRALAEQSSPEHQTAEQRITVLEEKLDELLRRREDPAAPDHLPPAEDQPPDETDEPESQTG